MKGKKEIDRNTTALQETLPEASTGRHASNIQVIIQKKSKRGRNGGGGFERRSAGLRGRVAQLRIREELIFRGGIKKESKKKKDSRGSSGSAEWGKPMRG